MSQQMVRLNPISVREDVLLIGAIVAVGGGGYWWYKRGNPTVTVSPGTVAVTAKAGGTVTLALPSGASWVAVVQGSSTSVGGAVASGTSNYPVTNVTNGEQIAASWKDASGAVQTTTITITAS